MSLKLACMLMPEDKSSCDEAWALCQGVTRSTCELRGRKTWWGGHDVALLISFRIYKPTEGIIYQN